ncbi:MAG: CHAD domain-containing protein [Leptospirales bacterium]
MTKHCSGKQKGEVKDCENALEGVLSDLYRKVMERKSRFEKDPEDPETLHLLRKSIRRFRSMLKFLGPLCSGSGGSLDLLRQDLKSCYRLLGAIREWDVLRADWDLLRSSLPEPWKNTAFPFRSNRDRLLTIPTDPILPALTPVFGEVIPPLREGIRKNGCSVRKFVRKRLSHWDERIIDGEKNWDSLDQTGRHQLRIDAKNLSGVFEVGRIFFPHRGDPGFRKALERVRVLLGGIHDRDRALELLSGFLESPDPCLSAPAGMLTGWYTAHGKDQEEEFMTIRSRFRTCRRPWQ